MPKNILWNNFRKMNTKCGLILIFLGVIVLLTSCQTSSVYVFDAETGQPVEEALVFAYSAEKIVLGPRQELNTTSPDGDALFLSASAPLFTVNCWNTSGNLAGR